jgi:hypothetical protein
MSRGLGSRQRDILADLELAQERGFGWKYGLSPMVLTWSAQPTRSDLVAVRRAVDGLEKLGLVQVARERGRPLVPDAATVRPRLGACLSRTRPRGPRGRTPECAVVLSVAYAVLRIVKATLTLEAEPSHNSHVGAVEV